MQPYPSVAIPHPLLAVGILSIALPAQAIRGTVVDADGKPVANARICLAEHGPLPQFRSYVVDSSAISRTKSNTQGAFAVDASRAAADTTHAVWIVTDNFADRCVVDLRPAGSAEIDLGKIKLKTGCTVQGTVRDGEGKPLSGATIQLFPYKTNTRLSPDRQFGWTTTTDSAGKYRIPNAYPGSIRVTATFPGLEVGSNASPESPQGLREVDLKLAQRGKSFSGIVIDDKQDPVAGARVRYHPNSLSRMKFRGQHDSEVIVPTDAQGRFVLHGNLRTTVEYEVRKPGYLPVRTRTVLSKDKPPKRIMLYPGLKVRLRVRTPQGGPPASFRAQLIHPASANNVTPFRTPAIRKGIAVLNNLPQGRYRVDIRCKGFAQHITQPFALVQGEPTPELEVRLSTGGTVSGQVVDAQGKPLANTKITITPSLEGTANAPVAFLKTFNKGARPPVQKKPTDATGRFRFTQLRAATYDLQIEHATHGTQVLRVEVRDGQAQALKQINILAGVEIHGVCLDREGNPIPRARVALGNLTKTRSVEVYADDKGVFRFPRRALPGKYTVMCAPQSENPLLVMKAFANSKSNFEVKTGDTEAVKLELSTR